MPRPPSSQPTDVELLILRALWKRGPSALGQVHGELSQDRDTGYTTTQKMLQVMLEKGLVLRDDSVRPPLYRAARSEQQTQLGMADNLVQKAFGGSAKKLVMQMLSANRVSPGEVAEMQKLIEQARGEDR